MKNKRRTRIVPVPVIKEQIRREEISLSKEFGRYLLDLSKLIIGGAVITTALQPNSDKYLIITIAVSLAVFLSGWGFLVLTNKKK
ncbi:DUF6722 family protein [uncultured Parabacteroides sp.]|jgi:hypothetical protein|uniref:DUF6722 family protein n=1 Tax=uncultured Parabacteroides sp. TaxID=512312 RepID=UPI0025D7EB56|nr:DUF6722 family protein [uncultured Parabacteroides sp.]